MAEKHPKIKKSEMKEIIDSAFDYITQSIVQGRRIEIRGFGCFSTKLRKAGKVRNPRHGISIDSPERKDVYFRPGKELAERANHKKMN
mgnify:FL=1